MRAHTLFVVGIAALVLTITYGGPLADNGVAGSTAVVKTAVFTGNAGVSGTASSPIIKIKGKFKGKGRGWGNHRGYGYGRNYDDWNDYGFGTWDSDYVRKCWWNGHETVCRLVPNPYWEF